MQIFLPPAGSPAGSRQKKIRNVALTI